MNQPRRVLAAAAVVALALTGCAHSASDAAVVDGVVVPDSEIQAASAALAQIRQQNAPTLTTEAVVREVQGIIAEKIAAKHNVALTDATRAEAVATDQETTALLATANGRTLGTRIANLWVVVAKVGAETIITECAATAVTLNPRYGTWSKDLCSIDDPAGSLSKPAPTPTPTKG